MGGRATCRSLRSWRLLDPRQCPERRIADDEGARIGMEMLDDRLGDREEQIPPAAYLVLRAVGKARQVIVDQELVEPLLDQLGEAARPVRLRAGLQCHRGYSSSTLVDRIEGGGGGNGATAGAGVTGRTPSASSPGWTCVLNRVTRVVR